MLYTFDVTPFASIVGELIRERSSGTLTIAAGAIRRLLYWSQGELILVAPTSDLDSLPSFLLQRNLIDGEQASRLVIPDPTDIVPIFHDAGIVDIPNKQFLLREWVASLTVPLFSLDEGTAGFEDEEPLDPDRRIFLQSMPALVLRGVRSIANGLVIRRALGDIKREIHRSPAPRYAASMLPLTEVEKTIAAALDRPITIEAYLRQFPAESLLAAKVTIGMLALGSFEEAEPETSRGSSDADTERDLALLATIGSGDPRSLRAITIARQLPRIDHYQLLEVPRAAARAQINSRIEELRRQYDPRTYPPAAGDAIAQILRRLDLISSVFDNSDSRHEYDLLLSRAKSDDLNFSMTQRIARREIAEKNFEKAKELSFVEDYYGAIVLLKQAVNFAPDHAEAWYLLGNCQQHNPKWIRDAAESYQKVLALNPNHLDALLSLGDLFRAQGLVSRAQSCYEEVLQIDPEHAEAKRRLKGLK
ncbi:MAG TPA: tetratricopeptide repeat protein [Thermoanaerobaculia bacterium]|nr:tetratricopeptide repeat protein [Thermoanaerobaculia bacterium]